MTGSGYFRVGGDAYGGDAWFDALRDDSDADTLIPLHDACIDISCRVIEHSHARQMESERDPALAILNHLLQDRFRGNSHASFEKRNDLFNLCAASDGYGPRSVMALTKLEWWGGEYEVHAP